MGIFAIDSNSIFTGPTEELGETLNLLPRQTELIGHINGSGNDGRIDHTEIVICSR